MSCGVSVMVLGDNAGRLGRQSPHGAHLSDLLIVGGGIMGLWATLEGASAGLSVTLAEAGGLASGASGGLLGALMPHMPDRWNAKKQFQFDALLSLEDEIRAIEEKTGLKSGYRRCGRLIPLPKPHLADIARGHQDDAARHWVSGEKRFYWNLRSPDFAGDLLAGEASAYGLVEETFAARVSPRGLTAALAAFLKSHPKVTLLEHSPVASLDPVGRVAVMASGARIGFGTAILAAGYRTAGLLEALCGPFSRAPVVPVKGQAALLAASLPADMPVVYLDGLYIVPHEGGRVAIGSTSENRFDDARSTDGALDGLIEAARLLMPLLREATVIERWAGLRPKAIGRDPMVGRLPGFDTIHVLTGGFKVSFGIAHVLARRLMGGILRGDGETGLPETFLPQNHLDLAG